MKLIVVSGTCGAGKSTIKDALDAMLDPGRFACVDSDEVGLNWWDYAGTERESKYCEDALREDVKPSAEAALRCRAAIDEIVMIENLEADKEEIAQTLAAICRQNNITMEQLKEQYDAALEQAVINSVLTGKVMRLIRDAAIVEEDK